MKIRYPLAAFLTALITLSSCEKTLKIDLGELPSPKLVINGMIEADSLPQLYISKTYPLYGDAVSNSKKGMVDKVNVKMYIDGKLVDEQEIVRAGDNNRVLIYNARVAPKENQLLRFEVDSPDLKEASFEEKMPAKPKIDNIKVEKIRTDADHFERAHYNMQKPYTNFILRIKITDTTYPAENFMGIRVSNLNKGDNKYDNAFSYIENVFLWTENDPLFPMASNAVMKEINTHYYLHQNSSMVIPFFSNKRMSSKEAVIEAWMPKLFEKQRNRIYVYSISQDYYRYGLQKYGIDTDTDEWEIDEDSGLTERTPTLTNIHNGVGLIILRSGNSRLFKEEDMSISK